jgi:hypothetical protein
MLSHLSPRQLDAMIWIGLALMLLAAVLYAWKS